jgi:hypothetical protein
MRSTCGQDSPRADIINDAREKSGTLPERSSFISMDLRKASLHPMLFRTNFTDDVLRKAERALLTDRQFIHRSCDITYELELMTDAELQIYFSQYKVRQDIYHIGKFANICHPSHRRLLNSCRTINATLILERLRCS